jgi:hypothetical protein
MQLPWVQETKQEPQRQQHVGTLEKCQTRNGTCLQTTLLNDKTMQKTRAFTYVYAPSPLFDAETMFSPGATFMRNVNFELI